MQVETCPCLVTAACGIKHPLCAVEQIKALSSKLSTCEKDLADAKGLLEAFVLAMRSGATTEEILETVRDGVGLTKEAAHG